MTKPKYKLVTILTILITTTFYGQVPGNMPTDGLVAYYSFNGNANDYSENDYDFGAMPAGGSNGSFWPFQGIIDDIGFWNRALTQEEITTINSNCILPAAPIGDAEQTFCEASTIADLTVTGENIQWYDAATGGNLLDPTTSLTDGQMVYASQTVNDCESTDRLEVVVSIQDITITASATEVCAGESVDLSVSSGLTAGSTACTSAELPANLQTGLVGYWPFCGNANDESGNGNNGTVNGATLTQDRFGNPNSAYYFSSSGCATRIDADVNTSTIQTGLTISLWVLREGDGCIGPRLFEFWPGANGPGLAQWKWDNVTQNIGIGSITSNGFVCFSPVPISPNNQWTQLTYTNDGNVGKFYKDGMLVNTITSSGNPILAGNLAIGRMNHPNWDAWNGRIDDFGIWNRALSQEEITNFYDECTPPTAPTGDTTQTFCDAPTIVDLSATGENIQWYDTATGGNLLDPTTSLTDGQIVYASQTVNSCESTDKLEVVVSIQDITITASATEVCAGESVDLSVSSGLTASSTACTSAELPANLQTGLVGYWPFCGNVNDESGNGNNGTVNGATLTTDRFGNADSAYSFDGDDWIDIGSVNLYDLTGGATISLVYKMSNSTSSNQLLLSHPNNESHRIQSSNNSVKFTINNGSWQSVLDQINTNEWTLITAVFDDSDDKIKIYRNGIFVNELSLTNTNFISDPAHSRLLLGGYFTGGTGSLIETYTGELDDIIIWDRALSSSEIQQLANSSTYTWSTGETTETISVTPTETIEYWVDVTTNSVTCREYITIDVTAPATPTGDAEQTFCEASTIADLTATGENIQWYDAATGGNLLDNTTALIDGQIVYASQTVNDCESTDRLEVTVSVQDITITASATEVCAGETATLNVTIANNSVSGSEGQLVNEFNHTITSIASQQFPTNIGVSYRLEIGGNVTWGTYCPALAYDPAYVLNGFYGVNEATPREFGCNDSMYSSIFCDSPGLRPIPDQYNGINHTYDYYFTANTNEITVGFTDNLLGDNCGSITFKLFENSSPPSQNSLVWSTNETTETISVTPTETIEYWVDVTTNSVTCREYITIDVTAPATPTGDAEQTFCEASTIADLTATGENIQWYDAATGGNLLDNTTALIDGQIVYASQTVNDCESTDRLEVSVTVQDIQITASATEICAGESVTLSLDYQTPTICDMDITLTDISLGEDIPGFTYGGFFNNHHYYVYDSPTTWTEGEQIARANGGYLVCINDESENTFVSNLTNNNIWIGLFRDAETCEFRWLDCIDIAYTNWRPGEPNSGPCGEPYAQIIRGCSFGFNTWNNLGNNASNGSCYSNMVPIMEIDPIIYEPHNLATASFLWSTGDTTETISVTPTTTTAYWLDVTTNGVTCRENITVTVNDVPLAPVSGGDMVSCAANSLDTLTAQASTNVNESVIWYNAATAGSIVTTPNWSEVGSITYYAEAVNTITGCTSETRTPVTLTIQAVPSAPNSPGNLEVCEVSPFNPLTATAIATPNQVVIWYDALEDGNIIDNPVLNTTGTITYYAEAQNVITGCLSITRTPVTLTINTAPNAPVSNGNITECELNPLQTITASAFVEANQSITWYNNAVGGIVIQNPSLSNTGVITYYAEAIDNDSGCTSLTRTPVTLTITNTPEPPEGQSIQEFCYAAQISDLLVTGENLAFYTSEFSTDNLPLDLNLNDGDRIYVSQSVNDCESLTRLEINIILHQIPDPTNTNTNLEFCLGANTTLADLEINEQGFDLEWYNAATGFTTYAPNTILENGVTYYATFYDPITGCESLNRLAIAPLIRPCNIKIYNALSLNGDGKNDYMVIENVQFYPINTLEVYNRNGQLVFKTTAYGQNNTNYFYGKANVSGIIGDGNKLPTGSYMYVFKYFDAFNAQEHKSLKGFLTINSH